MRLQWGRVLSFHYRLLARRLSELLLSKSGQYLNSGSWHFSLFGISVFKTCYRLHILVSKSDIGQNSTHWTQFYVESFFSWFHWKVTMLDPFGNGTHFECVYCTFLTSRSGRKEEPRNCTGWVWMTSKLEDEESFWSSTGPQSYGE